MATFARTLFVLCFATACGDDGGGGGSGGDCTSANDCPAGQVCDPSSESCADDLTCGTHGDCGRGGYCDDGTCAPNGTGGPCDDDQNCVGGESCMGGFCGCGGSFFQAQNVPPNMLISLDRSGSMVTNDVPGTSPTMNRWEVAQQAVASLLAQHGNNIRFGLKLWPGSNQSCSSGGSCSPGSIFVDPADGTGGTINSTLSGAGTCSFGTPITGSLDSLVGDSRLLDPERPNYVILITDGQQQSCTGDPVAAVTALRNQTPSVPTFVVGFSGDVDGTQLEAMAVAAGTERAGTPAYYQADNATELNAAFDQIAGSVLSCTYSLSDAPPDDDALYIYFDQMSIPNDMTDGWTYDPSTNTLTFSGASCEQLRTGQVTDLVIVYGCPIDIG